MATMGPLVTWRDYIAASICGGISDQEYQQAASTFYTQGIIASSDAYESGCIQNGDTWSLNRHREDMQTFSGDMLTRSQNKVQSLENRGLTDAASIEQYNVDALEGLVEYFDSETDINITDILQRIRNTLGNGTAVATFATVDANNNGIICKGEFATANATLTDAEVDSIFTTYAAGGATMTAAQYATFVAAVPATITVSATT